MTTRGRRQYRTYMESRALECRPGHQEEEWERFRRGWYQGEDSFRDQLLDRIEETKHGKKESSFGGQIIAEHNEKRAHELIQKCRGIFSISAAELKEMKENRPPQARRRLARQDANCHYKRVDRPGV